MTAKRRRRPTPTAGPTQTVGPALVTGPSAVEVSARHLKVGDGYTATLAVTGYPEHVGIAWLGPLLAWPGRLDVAFHIEPITAQAAAVKLRRQRARLESSRRLDAVQGRLGDPQVDAAAAAAADLAERVAHGTRLNYVAVYLTVHGPTLEHLEEAVAYVRATAASLMLDVHPVTFRHLHGWTSTLPLGCDSLRMRRVMDTDALAAAFPLASPDLPAPLPGEGATTSGLLYGLNPDSAGIVWWDRWTQTNHNSVLLARSGAGKSYFVKLELRRSLIDGVHVAVIDPEDEYIRLCDALGGVTVRLGSPGICVNPLQIPTGDTRPDALTRRALFLHTLVSVLFGQPPTPEQTAALDRGIAVVYARAGISNDPMTWLRPAPLLRDLAAVLSELDGDAGPGLAVRLAPWTSGNFRSLFDGQTTMPPSQQLTVWSTRQLPDELRPAGMLLALDAIWRDIDLAAPGEPVRRLVVVDEAWTLLRDGEGAKFLYRLSKQARKRRAGLAVVTQDAADVLGTDLGQAVVGNAATQILMGQAPQAIDAIAEAFDLTAGETRVLLALPRGQGLLLSGTHRVAFHAVASPAEHQLCIGDLETSHDM